MPLKVICVEGARGEGKSSVAQALRHSIFGSTLINLTGFTDTGEEGFSKISNYYRAIVMDLLANLKGDYTIIFDRMFFSEMVYSRLYKDYDFTERYHELCKQLAGVMRMTGGDFYLYYFNTSDREELARRNGLRKEAGKALLFDSVDESTLQWIRQQQEYKSVMADFNIHYGDRMGIHYEEIDTSGRSIVDIRDMILSSVGR